MWTIKEVSETPTTFLIIDEEGKAIAALYNREQAVSVIERYNLLLHTTEALNASNRA